MNKPNFRRRWAFVRKTPSPAWLAGEALAVSAVIFLLPLVFLEYRRADEKTAEREFGGATRIDAALPEYRRVLELRDPAALFGTDEFRGIAMPHAGRSRLQIKLPELAPVPLPPPPMPAEFRELTRPFSRSVAALKPRPERRTAAGIRAAGVILSENGQRIAELHSSRAVPALKSSLIRVVALSKYTVPVIDRSCGDSALDSWAASRLIRQPAGHYLVLWPGNVSAAKGGAR